MTRHVADTCYLPGASALSFGAALTPCVARPPPPHSMELPTSATFRLRSVFEATARGGSPGPATADDLGGSRLKRPVR